MNTQLTAKNAFVGGSSKGIGKATAIALAELGANVTLVGRKEAALQTALAELARDNGQQHDYLVADYDAPEKVVEQVKALIQEQERTYHILINNTGGPAGGAITQADHTEFLNAMNRHLICNHLLAQTLVEGMKAAGYGRIINITSTSVREPIPGLGVSNTTRWAVTGWGKTWANEVAKFGVTVNTILPGFVGTERLRSIIKNRAEKSGRSFEAQAKIMEGSVPLGRFAVPSELGNVVAFLASPAASYITGIVLPVDGGRLKSI